MDNETEIYSINRLFIISSLLLASRYCIFIDYAGAIGGYNLLQLQYVVDYCHRRQLWFTLFIIIDEDFNVDVSLSAVQYKYG